MSNPLILDVEDPLRVNLGMGLPSGNKILDPKKKRKKKLGTWAQELVDIRNSLGLTQDAFALAVGRVKDRIVNIENGRVKTEDEELMARARGLLDSDFETRVKPLEALSGMSMPEIIDRWWEMIGASDDKEGSVMMGLSIVTVTRWRENGVRPQPRDLLAHELMAKRIEAKRVTS
jgi:transcriptional regulator with XRE-family HTH domain